MSVRRLLLVGLGLGVTACVGGEPVGPTSIPTTVTLSATAVTFASLSDAERLRATVRDQTGATMSGTPVSWGSSATQVATVSSAGLVTSVGNGSATITASSGLASASATITVEQVAVTVEVSPSSRTFVLIGDTTTLSGNVKDALGAAVSGAVVTWSSSDATVATVSPAGLVTAVGNGTATITGTAGSISGTAVAKVDSPEPQVRGVTPAIWTEGQAATITGFGFDATASKNTVRVDGLTASITSASETELVITVPEAACEPSREARLVVKVAADSTTKTVGVQPATVAALEVGGAVYSTNGGDCIQLAAGSGTEKYVVGVLSTSENPSSLTSYTHTAIAGTSLAGVAASGPAVVSADVAFLESPGFQLGNRPLAGPDLSMEQVRDPRLDAAMRAHREAEARFRAAERRTLDELGLSGLGAEAAAAGLQRTAARMAPPSVGDLVPIRVFDANGTNLCTEYAEITTVVRYVGASAIYLEDVANPLSESFTTEEYQGFDQLLSGTTLPTVKEYFGDFVDVPGLGLDDEGRVGVVVTKEVNKSSAGSGFEQVFGRVFAGDLFSTASCPASNQAELFYSFVPDPEAVHGNAVSKDFVSTVMPPVIAHEVTHIIQRTQDVYLGSATGARWEREGGATLTEQLVGNAVLGHGSGQNLGLAEFFAGAVGSGWYRSWADDLIHYLGFSNDGRVPNAPEQCTWLGNEDDGNAGPCVNKARAVYGVPALLLRFILDRHGPSYDGGESALMRALTSSAEIGYSNLADVTGEDIGLLLTLFGMNLWADGRLLNGITSWDLFALSQGVPPTARLEPYTSSAAEPAATLAVRAGSTAYLEWSPPSSHAPTAFRITTPSGSDLPDEIVIWILRIE